MDTIIGIECQAYSRPPSILTWTLNNTIIQPQFNIKILTINTNSDSIAKSLLVINRISQANNGIYQCTAKDSINNEVLTTSPITISKFCIKNVLFL